MTRSHDLEKDKYYIINNQTGKSKRVNPCAQEFRIYDLKISGVAETKQRNLLAGNVETDDAETHFEV